MVTRITVPFLDANTVDVTVTAWRKAPGDRIETGEVVAELTTDKATFELESVGGGTLLEILAAPKSVVPSGYILALLGEPGEVDEGAAVCNQTLMEKYRAAAGQNPEFGIRNSESANQPGTRNPEPGTLPSTIHPPPAARVRATPRARRFALEHGIDLARVQAETNAEIIDEAVLQEYWKK